MPHSSHLKGERRGVGRQTQQGGVAQALLDGERWDEHVALGHICHLGLAAPAHKKKKAASVTAPTEHSEALRLSAAQCCSERKRLNKCMAHARRFPNSQRTSTHLWPSTSTVPVREDELPRSMADPAMEPSRVVLPQPAVAGEAPARAA